MTPTGKQVKHNGNVDKAHPVCFYINHRKIFLSESKKKVDAFA